MNEKLRNFMVGLFVLASMTVMSVMMVWFGEAPEWLGGAEWTLRIEGVDQLSGIGPGSPVNLNGVEIGRVKVLAFRNPARPDHGVIILARIKTGYIIPKGAFAKVYGATLGLGTGHVEIVIEEGVDLELIDTKAAIIQGEMRSVIGEMISKELVSSVEDMIVNIGGLADAAQPVAKNFADLIMPRSVSDVDAPDAAAQGFTANMATVVERLDKLIGNLNLVLGDEEIQTNLRTTIHDLKTTAELMTETVTVWKHESQRLSDNVNNRVDQTAQHLDVAFRRFNNTLDNLDESTSTLTRILQRVDAGEGSAGLLARDERLYESGVLALERLSELAATLQRVVGQAERDGYLKVGKATVLGPVYVNVPIGEVTGKLIKKIPSFDLDKPPIPLAGRN